MLDLDEKILDLKRDGKSLREIGAVLQISHEAVRKRLKALVSKDRMSTKAMDQELTVSTRVKEKASSGSNPRKSRLGEKSEVVVNQVSTKNAPPQTTTKGRNPSGDSLERTTEPFKPLVEEVSPGFEDLFEAIRKLLQGNGVNLYRMQVTPEAYQVRHNDQTIHIYVQRKLEYPVVPQGGRRKRDINGR